MTENNPLNERQAERHFQEARKKARRERFRAWLLGKQTSLIPFEVIRAEIQIFDPTTPTKQEIDVEKIVGSVGRYKEFTSHFLPLKDSFHDRWVAVQTHAMERGWPPIDVYQVGNSYFVSDGNHRVAIARQMGKETIEANVSVVPDSLDIDTTQPLDDVLIELGHANFMSMTQLNQSRPDHGIKMTAPGRYRPVSEQILRFRKVLADIDGETPEITDASQSWYDLVYTPTAMLIEESGLHTHFEGRTVSDLFVWLFQHRHSLLKQYGEYENRADLLKLISADFEAQPRDPDNRTLLERAKDAVSDLINPQDPEPTIFDEL